MFFELAQLELSLEDLGLTEMPDYKELIDDFFDFCDCYPARNFTYNAYQGTVEPREYMGNNGDSQEFGVDVSASIHISTIEDIAGIDQFIKYSLFTIQRKKLFIDEPTDTYELDSADMVLPDLKRVKLERNVSSDVDKLNQTMMHHQPLDLTQPLTLNQPLSLDLPFEMHMDTDESPNHPLKAFKNLKHKDDNVLNSQSPTIKIEITSAFFPSDQTFEDKFNECGFNSNIC
jgi:hypothetical protein